MRLYYQKGLKSYAQTLRKGGNLSEVLLWHEVKKDQLGYRFLRQKPRGRYIVDFYCPSLKLAIEIDGVARHDNKISQDEIRHQALESLGIRMMRLRDADVRYNINNVMEDIKAEILRLADSPPPFIKEE